MPDTWLDPYPQRLRMLLAEAGYPDAHVYVENGIFIDGVPDHVAERAFDIVNGSADLLVQGEPGA
jgi:hypothetical protein